MPATDRRAFLVLGGLGLAACASRLLMPVPFPASAAFLGDSITQNFGNLGQWFGTGAAGWRNAGVAGNRTFEALARLSRDVPSDAAFCVVALGVNDSANGFTVEATGENLAKIVTALRVMRVRPVLATVTPVTAGFKPLPPGPLNDRVRALNAWIRIYSSNNDVPLVDYYPRFAGPDGFGVPALYKDDGIHPNAVGQGALAAVAATALRNARLIP